MESKSKHKPDELLMDAFGFDEDDLAANRAGKLSAKQRTHFEHAYRYARHTNLYRTLAAILVTALILIAILLYPNGFGDMLWMQQALCMIGVPALGVAAFAVRRSLRTTRPMFRDLQSGTVKQVEGRVQLDVVGPVVDRNIYKAPPLYLAIEDQEWDIYREQFLAFKNGDPYAVYFTPHSRTILSVEWLRNPMPTQTLTESADSLETPSSEKRKRSP